MSRINRFLIKFLILAVMLLGLPLLGVLAAGYPIGRYLEFPPQTRYVAHAPFSWPAFAVIALSILAVVLPLAVKGFQSYKKPPAQTTRSISRPFSTVLPAVLSTRQWFLSLNWIRQAYGSVKPLAFPRPYQAAVFVLSLSAAGLTGIGIWPNYFFPVLWISPLLIITCLQALMQESHILSQIAEGDWSDAVSAALAATVCGAFWEMWNYCSLAKWEYSIPLVHRFQIFEMPLLGYAGYLPFGLECAAIGGMLGQLLHTPSPKNAP